MSVRDWPWGGIRLAVVVVGGLLVLQSSEHIDLPKLAYLATTLLCVGLSARRYIAERETNSAVELRPILLWSAALLAVLTLSLTAALTNGASLVDWFRGAVPYGLVALLPLLAWDAGTSTSRRYLVTLLVGVGVLAMAGWAVEWVDRRQLAELPIERVVLPAGRLGTLLYVFALTSSIARRRGALAWAVTAGAVLGVFLGTGSRSSLLLLLVPIALVAALRKLPLPHRLAMIVAHGLTAAAIFLAIGALPPPVRSTPPTNGPQPSPTRPGEVASDRLGSLGAGIRQVAQDPSVKERIAQYRAAWNVFVTSPLVGAGAGVRFEWIDVSGNVERNFTADTPLVLPAKLGILGTIVASLLAISYAERIRLSVRRFGWAVASVAAALFGVLLLVGLPLGMALEDKALSFAIAILLAVVIATDIERSGSRTE